MRKQNQNAAQDVVRMATANEEFKSDTVFGKRSVYRAEEQIKQHENLKLD